jgi:hypothetical protein
LRQLSASSNVAERTKLQGWKDQFLIFVKMALSEQTHRWLMHACTSDYPSEDITDNSGWPSGMMGPQRAKKLQAEGINNFAQLMKQATAPSMNEEKFKQKFGGKDGALDNAAGAFYEVLVTWHHAQCERKGHKVPQTDQWLMWADQHDLPAENLASRQGWPDGMLGEIRVAKLAGQGFTKTSQLMNQALTMSHEEFVSAFGGRNGALDSRASAFYSFLQRSAAHNNVKPTGRVPAPIPATHSNGNSAVNPKKEASPNIMLIAIVLLVLAVAYKFVA